MRSDSDMCPVFMDVSHEMWGGGGWMWGLDVGGRREKREREMHYKKGGAHRRVKGKRAVVYCRYPCKSNLYCIKIGR